MTDRATVAGGNADGRLGARLGLATLSGGAMLFVAGFAVFVASLEKVERVPVEASDAIVALTGGSQRIGDAIDLLSRGFASRLLITGVNERTSRDEIARLNPRQRRLVECCVDLDYRARNTVGNAAETRRWAERNGFRSLIVVTSNYHMPRTLAELDEALPQTRKVPFAVVTPGVDAEAPWHSLSTARLLVFEYAKYLTVLARTRFAPRTGGSGLPDLRGPIEDPVPEPVKLVARRVAR